MTVYNEHRQSVEIKCQLDATQVFIADLIACSCFGHHYAHHQELKSIIQWLPRVVFCAVDFSSSWSGVELRVMCVVCKMLHRRLYVEIKCQLDATEVFIADLIACSTCFGPHHAHHQELKSIIQWLLRVVFCAVVFQVAGLVWS